MQSDSEWKLPDPGRIVAGYGGEDCGTMAEYVPRELGRMRAWREASDQRPGMRNGEIAALRREQAQRRKQMERGEVEGPPNPFRPHRTR